MLYNMKNVCANFIYVTLKVLYDWLLFKENLLWCIFWSFYENVKGFNLPDA